MKLKWLTLIFASKALIKEFNSGSTGNWTRGRTNTITTYQSVAQFNCTA